MNLRRLDVPAVAICTAAICIGLMGCGGAPAGPKYPDPVPVKGVVTLDGAPLGTALVSFIPVGNKLLAAAGSTDAKGEFVLETGAGPEAKKGAMPGEYKVRISSMVGPDGKPVVVDPAKPPAMQLGHESLPDKYSRPDITELTATVTSTGGEFKFELTTK